MHAQARASFDRKARLMEDITHLIGHVLEHSIEDTLYLIPFLFVTYLAMEWLEHKAGDKAEDAVRRAGAAGPVVGALVGIVPQCGFSAAAATLWAGRVITLGTLFAVFLSTSDEMLPIFLAEQVAPATILKIMGVKLIDRHGHGIRGGRGHPPGAPRPREAAYPRAVRTRSLPLQRRLRNLRAAAGAGVRFRAR